MAQGEPLAVLARDWKPAALGSLVLVPVFVVLTVLVRGQVATALGIGDIVAVAVGTVGLTGATVLVAAWRGASRDPVVFYPDHVAVDGETVGYDAVAVAVRTDAAVSDDAAGTFGTGSYELFAPDETVLRFKHMENPQEVERILTDTIPAPEKRLAADGGPVDDGGGPEYIDTPRRFWEYWSAGRALPETALVDRETLKDALAVDSYEIELLDSVDVSDADGLSDIEEDDLHTDTTGRNHHG